MCPYVIVSFVFASYVGGQSLFGEEQHEMPIKDYFYSMVCNVMEMPQGINTRDHHKVNQRLVSKRLGLQGLLFASNSRGLQSKPLQKIYSYNFYNDIQERHKAYNLEKQEEVIIFIK